MRRTPKIRRKKLRTTSSSLLGGTLKVAYAAAIIPASVDILKGGK